MSAPVIGDIPGVPSVLGLLIILIAVQIMVHRQHIWVPQFLLRRSVQKEQLTRTLSWLERPAGWVDRILKQRLTVFISTPGRLVIAILCVTLALLTPAMEFVVFSANVAGLALVLLGLALVAHDGLMALIGFVLCASVGALLVWGLVL